MKTSLLPFLAVFAITLAGCGAQSADDVAAPSGASGASAADSSVADSSVAASDAAAQSAPVPGGSSPAGGGKAGALGAGAQSVSTTQRKIIYTATVDLVVENLTAGQNKLTQLVKANRGYIAQTDVGGNSGEQRTGSWKVRVPVDNYEAFMAGAAKLGELQSINSSSQDVTAEFYDVAARIKNKGVEEQRLIELLKKATGKLSEILQVEKELSRVRGEIEQLQGRIRVLSDLSSLTTITLTLREIKDYVPPAPPSFSTEIARQFRASLGVMRAAGKGLVLFGAALAPWLPFVLVGLGIWRHFGRKTK